MLQQFHHLQNIDVTEVGKKHSTDKKAKEVHAQHQGDVHGVKVDVLNWSLEMPNFQLDVSKIFGIGSEVGHQDEKDVSHRHCAFSLTDDKALDSICKIQNKVVQQILLDYEKRYLMATYLQHFFHFSCRE